jgi:hypothetical protein
MTQQRYTYLMCACGFWLAALVLFLVCNNAFGQSSQPASQPIIIAPVAAAGFWKWLAANSQWVFPLIGTTAATIATGLKDYPKAKGVVKALWMVVALFSVVQFKDGAGSLKLPFVPPALPPGSTAEKPKEPPKEQS